MKYFRTDNGQCRVYYKEAGLLYCIQKALGGGYEILRCSKDGEPSHKAQISNYFFPIPTGVTTTDIEVRHWLRKVGL